MKYFETNSTEKFTSSRKKDHFLTSVTREHQLVDILRISEGHDVGVVSTQSYIYFDYNKYTAYNNIICYSEYISKSSMTLNLENRILYLGYLVTS